MRHDLTASRVTWFLWVHLVQSHELYHPHCVNGYDACRSLKMQWASSGHKLVLEQLETVGIRDTLGCEEFLHTAQLLSKWFPAGLVVVCLSQWGQGFPSIPAHLHCHEQEEAEETDFTAWLKKVKIVSGLLTVCIKAITVFCLYRELKMQQIWPFIALSISLNWKRPQILSSFWFEISAFLTLPYTGHFYLYVDAKYLKFLKNQKIQAKQKTHNTTYFPSTISLQN